MYLPYNTGALLCILKLPMWEKNLKIQMNICICISEPLCCTLEINTTLQISYTLVKKKKWCVCVCVCVCHKTLLSHKNK